MWGAGVVGMMGRVGISGRGVVGGIKGGSSIIVRSFFLDDAPALT